MYDESGSFQVKGHEGLSPICASAARQGRRRRCGRIQGVHDKTSLSTFQTFSRGGASPHSFRMNGDQWYLHLTVGLEGTLGIPSGEIVAEAVVLDAGYDMATKRGNNDDRKMIDDRRSKDGTKQHEGGLSTMSR